MRTLSEHLVKAFILAVYAQSERVNASDGFALILLFLCLTVLGVAIYYRKTKKRPVFVNGKVSDRAIF